MTQTYAIPIHSMTDQITNSSTVIFTYSEGSEKALKDMVNEIFKVFGIDKTCDDVFSLRVGLTNNNRYSDALYELDDDDLPTELKGYENLGWKERNKVLDAYLEKVNNGDLPKPQWMVDVESNDDDCPPPTTLFITPKKPEYAHMAELVSKFLYSTSHEEGSQY